MITCDYCENEVDGNEDDCPNCSIKQTTGEWRICTRCDETTNSFCITCTKTLLNGTLPNPDDMSGEERAVEMVSWRGILEVPFNLMRGRISLLVGRTVMLHEFVYWGELVEEAKNRGDDEHPEPSEALARSVHLVPKKFKGTTVKVDLKDGSVSILSDSSDEIDTDVFDDFVSDDLFKGD